MTMTLVSTVTVGAGGAASIEFTGIPATGTDLLIVLSTRAAGSTGNPSTSMYVDINGSTANFTARRLEGNGSTVSSLSDASGLLPRTVADGATANTFGNHSVYLTNYAGSTSKSISADGVSENNSSTAYQNINAVLWSNSAAVTSLLFRLSGAANFAQYSTASLYTITKGSGGATVA